MKNLWLGMLRKLGLAYWLTVSVDGAEQSAYCFGPFGTAHAALSAQERCVQSLLTGSINASRILTARISMEP